MVKFGVLFFGSPGSAPSADLCHLSVSGHAVAAAHIQKQEDWQWMLAQGKSSSAKTKQNKPKNGNYKA